MQMGELYRNGGKWKIKQRLTTKIKWMMEGQWLTVLWKNNVRLEREMKRKREMKIRNDKTEKTLCEDDKN